jgi:hypothetical protein
MASAGEGGAGGARVSRGLMVASSASMARSSASSRGEGRCVGLLGRPEASAASWRKRVGAMADGILTSSTGGSPKTARRGRRSARLYGPGAEPVGGFPTGGMAPAGGGGGRPATASVDICGLRTVRPRAWARPRRAARVSLWRPGRRGPGGVALSRSGGSRGKSRGAASRSGFSKSFGGESLERSGGPLGPTTREMAAVSSRTLTERWKVRRHVSPALWDPPQGRGVWRGPALRTEVVTNSGTEDCRYAARDARQGWGGLPVRRC